MRTSCNDADDVDEAVDDADAAVDDDVPLS